MATYKLLISLVLIFQVSAFASQSSDFLLGGDISMLTRYEELGVVYKQEGRPRDFIQIMKTKGCNCFRLRLFVNPTNKNAVIQDIEYTVKLAKRIKAAGCRFLLDLHYSDTWADPAHQIKPAAWEDLKFPDLVKTVEHYTRDVIFRLKAENALPDVIQIGNEITPGFIWPDGKLGGDNPHIQWVRFSRLLKAAIKGVKETVDLNDKVRIAIHIDCGGDAAKTRWFFDKLKEYDVSYDVIALSYYPWWHGTMEDLKNNLAQTAKRYEKDILVVETAYPYRNPDRKLWKGNPAVSWDITRKGQKKFLSDLIETVHNTPDDRGIGVIWWYPESILTDGLHVWNAGDTALFDNTARALPALNAFKSHR